MTHPQKSTRQKIEKALFTIFVGLVLVVALWTAAQWSVRASIIVLVLGIIGLILALVQISQDLRPSVEEQEGSGGFFFDTQALETGSGWGHWEIWGWILGFYLIIHLVGFAAAVPLFVFAYTKFYGASWVLSLSLTGLAWGFLYSVFEKILHVPWPEPLIRSLFHA